MDAVGCTRTVLYISLPSSCTLYYFFFYFFFTLPVFFHPLLPCLLLKLNGNLHSTCPLSHSLIFSTLLFISIPLSHSHPSTPNTISSLHVHLPASASSVALKTNTSIIIFLESCATSLTFTCTNYLATNCASGKVEETLSTLC